MEDKHSSNHNKHNLLLPGPFNTSIHGINLLIFASSVCLRLTGFLAILRCERSFGFSATRTLKWTAKSPRLPQRGDKWSMQILRSPGAISSRVCLGVGDFFALIKSLLYMLILKVCCSWKDHPPFLYITLLLTNWKRFNATSFRSFHAVCSPKTNFSGSIASTIAWGIRNFLWKAKGVFTTNLISGTLKFL